MPERILYWHPESECLFEGTDSDWNFELENVTGIDLWEYRWALQDLLGIRWQDSEKVI